MCFKTTSEVLNKAGLTPTEKLILAVFANHLNAETGQCNPSMTRIMAASGYGKTTVIATIKSLLNSGILVKDENKNYQINLNIEVQNLNQKVQNLNQKTEKKGSKSEPKSSNIEQKGSKSEHRIEKNIEKNIEKEKNRFQEFWEKYPSSRREGKAKTETAYQVVLEKISEDDLFKAFEAQLQFWAQDKTPDKFKKYILRWLRDGSYEKFLPPKPEDKTKKMKQAIELFEKGLPWRFEQFGMTIEQARQHVNQKKLAA